MFIDLIERTLRDAGQPNLFNEDQRTNLDAIIVGHPDIAAADSIRNWMVTHGFAHLTSRPEVTTLAEAVEERRRESPAPEGVPMRVIQDFDVFRVGDIVHVHYSQESGSRNVLTTSNLERCWDLSSIVSMDGLNEREIAAGRPKGWWVTRGDIDTKFEPLEEVRETPRLDALMSDATLPTPSHTPFDKPLACDIIESFLRGTFSEEEIDALLALAGLKDAPTGTPNDAPLESYQGFYGGSQVTVYPTITYHDSSPLVLTVGYSEGWVMNQFAVNRERIPEALIDNSSLGYWVSPEAVRRADAGESPNEATEEPTASDLQVGDRVMIPTRADYVFEGRNGYEFDNLSREWPAYATVESIDEAGAIVHWETPEDADEPSVYVDLASLTKVEADVPATPEISASLHDRVSALEEFARQRGFTG